jgi:acetyl esterase/lipase
MASAGYDTVMKMLKAALPAGRAAPTPAKVRTLLDAMGAPAPRGVAVLPVDIHGLDAEWLVPEGAPTDARLVYLHGGGYVAGSRTSHRSLAGRIARAAQVPALLVDYRLAPEHPYPAALEDALETLQFAHEHAPDGSRSTTRRLLLCGDSAGGGLALATALVARDEGRFPVHAVATMSAWTDLAVTGDSVTTRAALDPYLSAEHLVPGANLYVGSADPRDPRVSALYGELAGFPPLLMHVGDHELLLDDTLRFAEKARAAGVDVVAEVWPEMFHVWHAFYGALDEARSAVKKLGEFLGEHAR